MIRRVIVCLALLALTACAPLIQKAGVPGLGFAGPRLESDAVISFDGARLAMNVWKAETPEPWAVIVGLHGMNDYARAFEAAAPYWAKQGITTYAYDQRGFGRSPERGIWPGETLTNEDLRTVTALVRARHPHAIIVVVGESMGSAIAVSAFASTRPPDADRLILMSPAVWGWSTQPLPQSISAWIAGRTVRDWKIEPPRFVVKRIHPTDNIAAWRALSRDPNMLFDTRMDAVYGIVDLMQTAWSKTGAIKVPTAYLYGQHDEVIPKKPSFQAAARLKPGDRTAYYPDSWHLMLIDRHAETVWRDAVAFIRDPNAPWPSGVAAIPPPASLKVARASKSSSKPAAMAERVGR
jgi:acylglycerol lipase